MIYLMEVPIQLQKEYLKKPISLSFFLSASPKLTFESISQIGNDGRLALPKFPDIKPCSATLSKLVRVIDPLKCIVSDVLQQGLGVALLSAKLQNVTENLDYIDHTLDMGPMGEISKGMTVCVEDIECDLKKSIIFGDRNELKTELVNILVSKGDEFFDIELILGEILPIKLQAAEWISFLVRIEQKGWMNEKAMMNPVSSFRSSFLGEPSSPMFELSKSVSVAGNLLGSVIDERTLNIPPKKVSFANHPTGKPLGDLSNSNFGANTI
eukprot:TRINITY_DN6529_c0_g3_i1.p1 TRINITY_DN6529_c0_g3~~TRINITY_DN6529_c0_g3_i1.p1  ORF type:complete len:268 (+),score=29.23 TRINITY_DN6529_c0_g3_i1:317-1120(+)